MAALIPLFADQANHLMARLVSFRPCGERLLDVRIYQLFWRPSTFQYLRIDLSQRGGALQVIGVVERNPGASSIHRHQQHAPRARMSLLRLPEEVEAAIFGQAKIGRDQRDGYAVTRQLIERMQSSLGRIDALRPVIWRESPSQDGRHRGMRFGVGVYEEYDWSPLIGGFDRIVHRFPPHMTRSLDDGWPHRPPFDQAIEKVAAFGPDLRGQTSSTELPVTVRR